MGYLANSKQKIDLKRLSSFMFQLAAGIYVISLLTRPVLMRFAYMPG